MKRGTHVSLEQKTVMGHSPIITRGETMRKNGIVGYGKLGQHLCSSIQRDKLGARICMESKFNCYWE